MSTSQYASDQGFYASAVTEGYVTWEPQQATAGTATTNPTLKIVRIEQKPGIAAELYFKYVKSKFSFLERMRADSRLKKLEKAFNGAINSGQTALAEKFMLECVREIRESLILAKGVKLFIEKEDLDKHKRSIRGGHISDTRFDKFTRVIPKEVLSKKKQVESVFDGFVIYHYYNEDLEKKAEKKQKMTDSERSAMRDPILFGWITESNRLYFIADWDDEFCDLSFEEITDVLGKDESEITIPRVPKLA